MRSCLPRPSAHYSGIVHDSAGVPDVDVVLATGSVYPESSATAFEIAARLGFDGVEVMVSTDPVSQDIDALKRLSDYHEIPIRAIHAPCLLITQFVWGNDPWAKLERSVEAAEKLGSTAVVVHPPFRWQVDYARDFVGKIARLQQMTGIAVADWLRPPEARSHLGEFVARMLAGDAGELILRKAESSLSTLLFPFAGPFAVVTFTLAGIAVWRPMKLRFTVLQRAFDRMPLLRSTLVSIIVTSLIGTFANDTGVVIPGMALLLTVPLMVATCLRLPETGVTDQDRA